MRVCVRVRVMMRRIGLYWWNKLVLPATGVLSWLIYTRTRSRARRKGLPPRFLVSRCSRNLLLDLSFFLFKFYLFFRFFSAIFFLYVLIRRSTGHHLVSKRCNNGVCICVNITYFSLVLYLLSISSLLLVYILFHNSTVRDFFLFLYLNYVIWCFLSFSVPPVHFLPQFLNI